MRHQVIIIIVGMLFVALGFGEPTHFPSSIGSAHGQTMLSVEPESTVVSTGTFFSLAINLSADATELMGYNVVIRFDPTVIRVVAVEEGTLPQTSGFTTFFRWLNAATASDSLRVNGAILGNTVAGPGELFTIHFQGLDLTSERTSPVAFVYSDVRNGMNQTLEHITRDGVVTVLRPVPVVPTNWGELKSWYRAP